MKNLYKYISAIAVMGTFTACTPLTESFTMDDAVIPANDLQLSVATQQVNGKNGNIIIVENHSPILSEWIVGQTVEHKAYAEMQVSFTGRHIVNFHGFTAGSDIYSEKVFTVQVDTISTISSDISTRLCMGQKDAPTYFGTSIDLGNIEFSLDKNILTVKNSNPVLTDWECGGVTSDKNLAVMKMNRIGEFTLSATFTLANGQQRTEELGTVEVKQLELPQIALDLMGENGEKTWAWEEKNFYGFGGYNASMSPDWFAYDAATMGMYASYFGMGGEETGRMTLFADGHFEVSPTGRTGLFTYDFDDVVPNWSVGKLKVEGSIILGMAINMEDYQPSYLPTEFYIVRCDAGHLVLAATTSQGTVPYDGTPMNFWCLKSAE